MKDPRRVAASRPLDRPAARTSRRRSSFAALLLGGVLLLAGAEESRARRSCPPPNLPPGVELEGAKLRYTKGCLPFVRTPKRHTRRLADFPYRSRTVKVDGLRMAYVDAGPRDGEVVLLLHGQPSWSYLYRKMIPVLADAGFRVIAPDLIGMGRSDKPVELERYSYLQHVAWLEEFLDAVPSEGPGWGDDSDDSDSGAHRYKKPKKQKKHKKQKRQKRQKKNARRGLRDITLFCQDWGSLIGLRVVGNQPERFARVVVANGRLPVIPFDIDLIRVPEPPLLDPSLPFPFDPADPCLLPGLQCFERWATYALTSPTFRPSEVIEVLTVVELSEEEEEAYDAPFPSRVYMAGPRTFPSLINTLGEAPTNLAARAVFDDFQKPLLTLFGRLDPNLGSEAVQAELRNTVPGAAEQPHHAYPDAGHFVQEDQGEDLAWRVASFIQTNPLAGPPPIRVGHELLEISFPRLVVWGSQELTIEEFDALVLPPGFLRNQPREGVGAEGRFLRSPGRDADGEFTRREMFGISWLHQATVVRVNEVLDPDGLLVAATVEKHHELTWRAGRSLTVLTSPEGLRYVLVSRDARRSSDSPTIPAGWRLETVPLDADLTIFLPLRTFNIRADNQDSFQGPLPAELEL